MNKWPADLQALRLHLEFAFRNDLGWGGYCRTLEEAKQTCEQAAGEPLSWHEDGFSWSSQAPRGHAQFWIHRL